MCCSIHIVCYRFVAAQSEIQLTRTFFLSKAEFYEICKKQNM